MLLGDPALRLPFRALDLTLTSDLPEFIPPDVPAAIMLRIENAAEMLRARFGPAALPLRRR